MNTWVLDGTVVQHGGTSYMLTHITVSHSIQVTFLPARTVNIAQVIAEVTSPTPLAVQVPVTLTAQGDENALGGSINYDPTVLTNPQVTLDADDAGGMLAVNTGTPGSLSFIVSLQPGQTFAAGARQAALLTFTLVSNSYAGTTPLTFSTTPVSGEVIDSNADYLDAIWVNGSITINQPPLAVNDTYATNVNTPLTVTAATGVLVNDTSNNGNALTAVLPGGGSTGTTANGGSVTLNADGSFSYTPPHNIVKADTFSYQAYDGVAYSQHRHRHHHHYPDRLGRRCGPTPGW